MNRQDLIHLLKMLDESSYVMGSTQMYTYIVYLNVQTGKSNRGAKRYILKKISRNGPATHAIPFDRCAEILPQMACKSMMLCRPSNDGCPSQEYHLAAQERTAHYLPH